MEGASTATNPTQLEEDVALANIALDLLGQARTLLTYAGEIEQAGRDEDGPADQHTDLDGKVLAEPGENATDETPLARISHTIFA